MLKRGEQGKKGGLVLVDKAADLARVFAEKTGIVLEDARKMLQASVLQGNEPTAAERAEAERQFKETEQAHGGKLAYEKAKAAGKTKLNYGQWVQVRTPNFKAWFGDWENGQDQSMANGTTGRPEQKTASASAKVDGGSKELRGSGRISDVTIDTETGEPRIFYHGTKDDITFFDASHPNRKDRGWLGRGSYVTSDALLAGTYANLKREGAAGPNILEVFVRPASGIYMADIDFKRKMSRVSQKTVDDVTRQMIDAGFDGAAVIFGDGTIELATFKPENIKSATGNAGTFNPNNPDIRYSSDGQIQALYHKPSGLSFLVGENTDLEASTGVVLHEVTHSQQGNAFADKVTKRANELINMRKAARADIRALLDRVVNRMVPGKKTL